MFRTQCHSDRTKLLQTKTAGHKKARKVFQKKNKYLLREALHQNGDQQVEQHIVAERHQNDEIQRSPMEIEMDNEKRRKKEKDKLVRGKNKNLDNHKADMIKV